MEKQELIDLLTSVSNHTTSVEEAELKLKEEPFLDLGFAKIDTHRGIRQGAHEVIYGAGKTPERIAEIVRKMKAAGEERILITKTDEEKANQVAHLLDMRISDKDSDFYYNLDAKIIIVGGLPKRRTKGKIVVATGGTSDIPVAEEAALTAEFLGNTVTRLYDVGVSGLHRLLSHTDEIMTANVIIAIAGMEGALASVIGGLADCPVIAVPTSVGYGANFGGLSALLSMLDSCASGVSVVNIDNGFGAGYQASMINHLAEK